MAVDAGSSLDTFESVNPATGEVLATYPVDGPQEVARAVRSAQAAAAWWGGLSFADRRLRLLAWKSHLTRHLGQLAQVVHEETGKPLDDATLEIVNTILHLDWAARHAQVIGFAAVPALPFGGSGESGFGRIHGAAGLREFARAKSVTRQWMKPLVRTTTFGRTTADLDRIVKLVTVLHGRRHRKPRWR
jgi:acyl-CoA reductase-like NAD-dependent aldehyde dehydrogenase